MELPSKGTGKVTRSVVRIFRGKSDGSDLWFRISIILPLRLQCFDGFHLRPRRKDKIKVGYWIHVVSNTIV